MNKQEAIEKIKNIDTLNINDIIAGQSVDMVIKNQVIDLISQINEPQKPVVPKFVAEWVDNSREYCFDFDEWLDYENQPLKVYNWLNQENKRQAELNALALITLIVNGANAVEIEKEKLYTVKVLDSTLFKMTSDNHVRYKLIGENGIPSESKIGNYTFEVNLTEKEIKKANELLRKFAKLVEDK